ncbi:MAG: BamA/TamA family outer membrane protein, partial [Bacteroidota bacterium]
MLIKNKIRISSPKVSSDELTGYLQQTPNSKLFGIFRSNIALYNWGCKGKETKFKKWLKEKAGTAPVLLDSSMNAIAIKQMGLYLNNKGYFNSQIYDSIARKKKKATVYYLVKLSEPFIITDVRYTIQDKVFASFVYRDTAECLIKKWSNYDSYLFDNERTRIAGNLLNQGFYQFSTSFIKFHIDSLQKARTMRVNIEIFNPVVPSLSYFGALTDVPHKRFRIHRIFIYSDYDLIQKEELSYDTLIQGFLSDRHDTTHYFYSYLYNGKLKIKPRTVVQTLFLKTGDYYNASEVLKTYTNLGRLPIFRYKNIQFKEVFDTAHPNRNLIDCKILLSREQVHSFSVSTDGTNSAGAFGLQGNLIYQNRNIFRGAQFLRVNLSASAMTQGSTSGSAKTLFNTLEFGINASLTFPQFLVPIKQEVLPRRLKPRTTIKLGYNFQKQADYDRHISNISFGYNWSQTEKLGHVFNPIELSFVKVLPDSLFLVWLNNLTDKRQINQYTNHLVAGMRYTITYNSQDRSNAKDFFYIRSNIQTGGNLFYSINSLFNSQRTGSSYTLFGVPYAQFIRPDIDFRYFVNPSKTTMLVFRFYGGIGISYGNSIALPFEKAFFAGGSNDIRGWRMGTLGPGGYYSDTVTNNYSQIGDIQLQGNIEYRFPVYRFFKGALFTDFGNIWLLR